MLPMLTCATLQSFPPPSVNPHHYNNNNNPPQILHRNNKIITQNVTKLKPIQANANAKQSLFLYNLYLQLYTNAGLMDKAQNLFDEMPHRTLVSWTILMSGYTRHGPIIETLLIFQKMVQNDDFKSIQPDSFVYGIVLRACSSLEYLDYGRQVHCRILKVDGVMDSFVENALVMMYSSCGSTKDSTRVFDGILRPNVVSWSSMFNGYIQNGMGEEGLRFFCMMVKAGVKPDVFSFSMVIGACATLGYSDFGIQVHCCMIKMGFCSSVYLQNSLMDFYAKCGDSSSLEQVFYEMPERNLVSWNTVIKGLVLNHQSWDALRLFRIMMNEAFYCDDYTLPSVLEAITDVGALSRGREVHGYAIRAGYESNVFVISSLLDMYIECIDHESPDPMREVPLKIFSQLNGKQCDDFIFTSILKCCSLKSDLETGKSIHSHIIKQNMQSDPFVASSLIDMYSKCSIPDAALTVFMRVPEKTVVPLSAIIAGHCWNGLFEDALRIFGTMQSIRVEANEFIYSSVLSACLALGDSGKLRQVHCRIIRSNYGSNISVTNTLIGLYSELLLIEQALKLCSLIPDSEISWDFLVQACWRIQDQVTMFKIVRRIQLCHGEINSTSASHILNSCANVVLLNGGRQIQAYVTKRGLLSDLSTSNSLIKMYSKGGRFADAAQAFSCMFEKNSDSWTSLISANVNYGHSSEAIQLFTQMCNKNKSPNSTTFVSALKAYAHMGLVDEAFHLFTSMVENYDIEPTIGHYCCMVEVFGRAGMFEEAKEFIDHVFKLEPVPKVWKILLSGCRKHDDTNTAKYIAEKLLKLEPTDVTANLLLQKVLLAEGRWDDALKMKINCNSTSPSSSWIEVRNKVYEFVSDQIPDDAISIKLSEMERTMKELGYVADRNHLLHNSEEEEYAGPGLHHTEMKALAFGLLSLSPGVPIRIMKNIRMCGDCHSACKFMSTFLGRDLVVKDSCKYHNFSNGKCSCKNAW